VQIVLFTLVWLLFAAAPSQAHSAEGSAASNYQTVLNPLNPTPTGFAVREIEQGNRLEVRWLRGDPVIVDGVYDEPYLRIGPDGVEENLQSPATYTNRTRDGSAPIPDDLNPDGPPEWKRTSSEPVARFHDHRIHYMGSVPPEQVENEPTKPHLISPFLIVLRQGSAVSELTGEVRWVPSPNPTKFYVVAVAFGVIAGALGLWAGVSRLRRRSARPFVLLLLAVLVVVDVIHLVGIAGGVQGGSVLGRMITIGYASMAAWVLAMLSAVLWLRGRDDALYLTTFAAGLMTLVGGIADIGIMSKSAVVFLWSGDVARWTVALTLGLGAGLVTAAVLLTRPAVDGPIPEVRGLP
jgi:hypothetical protein